MKILLYTFRTFPKEKLDQNNFSEIFQFGKLRQDLDLFQKLIEERKPEIIIGFALSNLSRQESIAINQFNKGCINSPGPAVVELTLLQGSPFKTAKIPTHSFCNWTMYMLAQKYPLSFYHVRYNDSDEFFKFLKEIIL